MSKDQFRFKQFSVRHKESSMPVGTDAVLLGSWVDIDNAKSILDVGTGCGVLALMLAQRSNAMITGIDIDQASIEEASLNAAASPWKDRLEFRQMSLQEMDGERFDLIVSNPPYFPNDLVSPEPRRQLARQGEQLDAQELLISASDLLTENGRISMIIPASTCSLVRRIPADMALTRFTRVIPKNEAPVKLMLMEYGPDNYKKARSSDLILRDDIGRITEEYRRLTEDFYLDLK